MIVDIRVNGEIRRLSENAQAVPRVGDVILDPVATGAHVRVHAVLWSDNLQGVLLDTVPVNSGRQDSK